MLIFHIFNYKDYQINCKKAKCLLLPSANNSPNNKNAHLLRKKAQVLSSLFTSELCICLYTGNKNKRVCLILLSSRSTHAPNTLIKFCNVWVKNSSENYSHAVSTRFKIKLESVLNLRKTIRLKHITHTSMADLCYLYQFMPFNQLKNP